MPQALFALVAVVASPVAPGNVTMVGDSKSAAIVRQVLTAAARNDLATFRRLTTPDARSTINGGVTEKLKIDYVKVYQPCRISKIDATVPTEVLANGGCVQMVRDRNGRPFAHSWPLGFDFYLKAGRIVRVNRRVYPW